MEKRLTSSRGLSLQWTTFGGDKGRWRRDRRRGRSTAGRRSGELADEVLKTEVEILLQLCKLLLYHVHSGDLRLRGRVKGKLPLQTSFVGIGLIQSRAEVLGISLGRQQLILGSS